MAQQYPRLWGWAALSFKTDTGRLALVLRQSTLQLSIAKLYLSYLTKLCQPLPGQSSVGLSWPFFSFRSWARCRRLASLQPPSGPLLPHRHLIPSFCECVCTWHNVWKFCARIWVWCHVLRMFLFRFRCQTSCPHTSGVCVTCRWDLKALACFHGAEMCWDFVHLALSRSSRFMLVMKSSLGWSILQVGSGQCMNQLLLGLWFTKASINGHRPETLAKSFTKYLGIVTLLAPFCVQGFFIFVCVLWCSVQRSLVCKHGLLRLISQPGHSLNTCSSYETPHVPGSDRSSASDFQWHVFFSCGLYWTWCSQMFSETQKRFEVGKLQSPCCVSCDFIRRQRDFGLDWEEK